jgi:hypothetical protein
MIPGDRTVSSAGYPLTLAEFSTSQLRLLSRAIDADPEEPVNYLLRAEEWLVCGHWQRARADFERARVLAEHRLAESAWGYIYQSYLDRVAQGLRQCG